MWGGFSKSDVAPQARVTRITPPGAPQEERDDTELMLRVAAQDRQAFEWLYHRYAAGLQNYLVKWVGQREVAEEVLNDVMLTVWQTAVRFDSSARLSTWIFGIAYHKALKARAKAHRQTPALPPIAPNTLEGANPEDLLERQEDRNILAQALTTLSPEQRAVMELTFHQGYSYQEIATIMDCPVNTVKTRMFHARRRLVQSLTNGEPSAL